MPNTNHGIMNIEHRDILVIRNLDSSEVNNDGKGSTGGIDFVVDLERRGESDASGVEPVQMRSEHPRDNFAANLQTFVTQVGLAVGEPRNIVSGDSSAYNYSSAQLDNEIFSRWGGTCQRQIQRALNKTLELCFAAHLHSDPAVSELFALIGDDDIPCVWYFPRMLESIDRLKDASADVALLNANLQTIREYCNRHGIDYEQHVKQMEAEKLLHPEELL